ncbi:kinase-like domain-containing protein [Hyaloscypha sp. PMI_1271]|nr:kinase-like domain-containing protein [Hyaloscypha sp. PMI_1271]
MTGLKKVIEDLRCDVYDNNDEQKLKFIPRQSLFTSLTSDLVQKAIEAVPDIPFYLQTYTVDWIMTKGRRIFAILVLLDNRERWISDFIKHDRFGDAPMDERLPFSLEFLQSNIPDIANEFYNQQWEFVSPVLSRNIMHRVLPAGVRLPFIYNQFIARGAFGDVYEIELHPDHQTSQLLPQGANGLARKEFKVQRPVSGTQAKTPGDWVDYNKELRNLSILNELGHPNIIELLSSYTHGDKHNLIFPLVRDGNLHSFLLEDRPAFFALDETFLKSLCGLASAIEKVHYYSLEKLQIEMIGCHHDLKPKNILVQETAFVLSDFGLSKLKEPTEEATKSFYENGEGDYLAPECFHRADGSQKHTISRPSDIWSFGCTILEILTYMQGGRQAVIDFRAARKETLNHQVMRAFHRGVGKSKPAVEDKLKDLANVDSIKIDHRLVELVASMLELETEARPNAKQVASRLRFIFVSRLTSLIRERYEILDTKLPDSFERHVEMERQKSWTSVFESAVDEADRWSHALDQKMNLASISSSLATIRNELDFIIDRHESAFSPLFTNLSIANDQLLDILPVDPVNLQILAKAEFQLSMLKSDDEEKLEMTRKAFEQRPYGDNISAMATLKRKSILAAESVKTSSSSLALDGKLIQRPKLFNDHTIATVPSNGGDPERRVLIEWIHYTKFETKNISILSNRVEALASALSSSAHPDDFRVLPCCGFTHDFSKTAYGVLYDLRAHSNDIPRNLANVLEGTKTATERPTLESRFRLAYTLALSLSSFHKIGWLHKGISASNVLCFSLQGSKFSEWLQSPFLIGFNHSRQKDPLSFTVGPTKNAAAKKYHHPLYLEMHGPQVRYRLEFDHYSLGLVLLEIGLWQTLEKLTEKMKVTSHQERLDQICVSKVPILGHQMGTAYKDAVLACLMGVKKGQGALGDEVMADRNAALQLAFMRQVLEPLRKLCIQV